MKTIEEMWGLCSSTLARRHFKVSNNEVHASNVNRYILERWGMMVSHELKM